MTERGSSPGRRPRVFLAGATGYIGQAVARELLRRGIRAVCFARTRAGVKSVLDEAAIQRALAGTEVRFGDVTSAASAAGDGFRGEPFDAVISCLATRSGEPKDAWSIEYEAQRHVLRAARAVGVERFVLLSAICVQKPRLAFQHAKLAFEAELVASGMAHAIVRPTAFFKSLSGQIPRLQAGKPYLLFGSGELTACKPISERDLARFLVDRLDGETGVFPVGGPGPALTPRAQGELLFDVLGKTPRFRHVPLRLFDGIAAGLSLSARLLPMLRGKAELARIGRYYATESMLLWDEQEGRYDAAATPSFGVDTLRDHFERVARHGLAGQELGDHSVFGG